MYVYVESVFYSMFMQPSVAINLLLLKVITFQSKIKVLAIVSRGLFVFVCNALLQELPIRLFISSLAEMRLSKEGAKALRDNAAACHGAQVRDRETREHQWFGR